MKSVYMFVRRSTSWPILLQENMKGVFKQLEAEFTKDNINATLHQLQDILKEVTFLREDVSKYRIKNR